MKSFTESLQITNNMNLAKQCFTLMAEKGIDPRQYVEWYCDFGIHYQEKNILFESSIKWLKTEASLTEIEMPQWATNAGQYIKKQVGNYLNPEAMGGYVAKANKLGGQIGQAATNIQNKFHQGMGQPTWWRQAAAAEQALNQLHRRIGVSPQLSQAVGGQAFMQTVLQLMQVLKSKDPSQITSSATPMPPEDSTGDAWRGHTESLKLKNDIRDGLKTLLSLGHDPVAFVEWFGQEINNLNEGLWDSTKEFLGNTWANTMGTANRWLTGGEKQKWGHDSSQRVSRKDSEAITQAMQTLNGFQKSIGNLNPEFKKTLDGVLNVLQSDPVKQHISGRTAAAPVSSPETETPTSAPAAPAIPETEPSTSVPSAPSTADAMHQNQKPVKSDIVGQEMYKASLGDFSAFGDRSEEMSVEWEQIKNLRDDDPKKHERFAYLMRYFSHPRQNEIKNIRGNILSEAMYLAGITIR